MAISSYNSHGHSDGRISNDSLRHDSTMLIVRSAIQLSIGGILHFKRRSRDRNVRSRYLAQCVLP